MEKFRNAEFVIDTEGHIGKFVLESWQYPLPKGECWVDYNENGTGSAFRRHTRKTISSIRRLTKAEFVLLKLEE